MWKQDIGQWVERKGRKGWVRQAQGPSAQNPTVPAGAPVSSRCLSRGGFIPDGFEEKESDPIAPLSDVPSVEALKSTPQNSPGSGQLWVTVYGVSPTSILDVRECLDVKFGRTVMHKYPVPSAGSIGRPPFRTGAAYNGSQNWFYIKFEDPLAAARAVSQSPLILSAPLTHRREETITAPAGAVTEKDMNGVSVREEVVGITWCTDEAFLQQQIKQEQMQSSTAEEWAGSRGNGTATERSGESQGEKDNGIRNALGITPCGVDRLQRSPTPSPPSEKCSQRQRRAHSRGLISLIREVLYSPWSGQWAKGSSRQEFTPQDSSHGRNAYDKPSDDNSTLSSCSADTHTDVFRGDSFSEQNNNTRSGRSVVSNADPMGYPFDGAGIPSGHLHCRRRHYHTPEEQIKSGKPIRPLPGNSSVMCAFKADVSQRSLLKRIVRGALYAPSRIIHFLSERELGTEGERSYFNVAGEAPPTPCEDWDVSSRRQSLVRNRHFNAESRLYSLNTRQTGQTSSLVLAEWAPARWHENRILFSLLVVIMLFVFPYTTSQVDLSSTFTWGAGDISSSQEKVLNNNAYAGSGHQPDADTVQNVVLTSSGYRSDKYRARTL